MTDTLLFIHGTGVRQEGYEQSMRLLKKGFKDLLPIEIEGICWGPQFGVNVDRKAIDQVLPPTLTRTADVGPEEIGLQAALWGELLRDPLIELRMASMRLPTQAKRNAALPGIQAPDRMPQVRLLVRA